MVHKLRRKPVEPLDFPTCITALNNYRLSFHISEGTQALQKNLLKGRPWPNAVRQPAYFGNFSGLLRAAGERPDQEAASEDDDESPAGDHWISSSARISNVCGMVSPSAFAVLRLITSSNFVGCSTGSSAGLEPLRILSMKIGARPIRARRLGP